MFVTKVKQRKFKQYENIVRMKHVGGSLYLVSQNPKYLPRRLKELLSSLGKALVMMVLCPIAVIITILELLWFPFEMLPRLYDFCLGDEPEITIE